MNEIMVKQILTFNRLQNSLRCNCRVIVNKTECKLHGNKKKN